MIRFIAGLFTLQFWREFIYKHRKHCFIYLTNSKVRRQKKDCLSIPIIIINYNRLHTLRLLIESLLLHKHANIIVLDNKSTYPPLLKYYEEIKSKINIQIMDQNYGHLVFWLNDTIFKKYADGYYVITDSDILLNKNLPDNYIEQMLRILDKNKNITKVGFALRVDNIPNYYTAKDKVIAWEKQFWSNPLSDSMYLAKIDTTFAIYPPYYKHKKDENYYKAIRIAGNFLATHGGWYIDPNNLTEEDHFYFQSVNNSSSWKFDGKGNFTGNDMYLDE